MYEYRRFFREHKDKFECKAEFRIEMNDLLLLADVLGMQGTVYQEMKSSVNMPEAVCLPMSPVRHEATF